MDGRAKAPGAGTILNALATGTGSAFAIDLYTTASVSLGDDDAITGSIAERPDGDTHLIETCVKMTLETFGDGVATGGEVYTESEVPLAAGLKSSSAAANATVLATLDALEKSEDVDRIEATKLGVAAARRAGVTVTGAFDDASASMLGGVTLTDNTEDRLLAHDHFDAAVAIHTPPEEAFTVDADVDRCTRLSPIADLVAELAESGRYGTAMTVNGLAFSAALDHTTEPTMQALPDVRGVSLSGTGPSTVAIGETAAIERVADTWGDQPGTVRTTRTQQDGAVVL